MKKIMFNDRFLLTQAVLEGRKTQTRRLVKNGVPLGNYEEAVTHSTYKVGEVVAVAQRYSDVGAASFDEWERNTDWFKKGFSNKLFVKSELMPYHIKITNARVQRLQDITDEECLLEGVKKAIIGYYVNGIKVKDWQKESHRETEYGCMKLFPNPREAFAALIDKISGKGTWESNPYVLAYNFELVKYK